MSEVNSKVNVPQFRQEFQQLSKEYGEVMAKYEGICLQYRQLLALSQQMVREINQLATYQETQPVAKMTEMDWKKYYQKISQTIEVCYLLGEGIGQGMSANALIGHYLVGAKHEAAAIIEKAKSQAALSEKGQVKGVEEELRERDQRILELEQLILTYQEKVTLTEGPHEIGNVDNAISDEEYAKKVRREADRYSRKRKLIADNQVQHAKKEIDEYIAKRQEILRESEERLVMLTEKMQEQFGTQLDETMESIAYYAKSEKINL